MRSHPTIQDPALSLLALHKKQFAAWLGMSDTGPYSDGESDRLSNIANETWWLMLDTMPGSMAAAVAIAEWVAELEARDLAPNLRHKTEESEENVVLIALNSVLHFYRTDHHNSFAVAAE